MDAVCFIYVKVIVWKFVYHKELIIHEIHWTYLLLDIDFSILIPIFKILPIKLREMRIYRQRLLIRLLLLLSIHWIQQIALEKAIRCHSKEQLLKATDVEKADIAEYWFGGSFFIWVDDVFVDFVDGVGALLVWDLVESRAVLSCCRIIWETYFTRAFL